MIFFSQSMVDELLNQKNGYDMNSIQTTLASDYQLDYIKRDDSSIGRLSDSSTSDGSINSLVNICATISLVIDSYRICFRTR